MRQESFLYSIIRLLSLAGICFFLGMLYWSSNSVEQDLIELKQEIISLKSDITDISFKTQNLSLSTSEGKIAASSLERKWDDKLPNLLEEDVYMEKTLPEMLPKDFKPYGTRHDGTYVKPENLNPFSGNGSLNGYIRQCVGAVGRGKVGLHESLAPDMALKMEQKSPTEYWIYLKEGLYWQPLEKSWFPADFELDPVFLKRHPVTAHDFKFYYDAFMNPAMTEPSATAQRTIFQAMESVTVVDDYTFIVKWSRDVYISKLYTAGLNPLPSFVYKYFSDGKKIIEDDSDPDTYRKNPIWVLNFTNHWAKNIIVGCGAWFFDGMTDRMLSFKRNPNHYFKNEVLMQRMELEFRSSPEVLWQDFKEGKTDFYTLTPQQRLEFENFLKSPIYEKQVKENKAIKQMEYISQSYFFIAWNQSNPLFKSKKVRQALTMGIDRDRIIRQTLNGQGIPIHGAFNFSSPSNDPSIHPMPFDPLVAKRMLAEEGWYDSDGDGIIDKEIKGSRVPFRFGLTYYTKNTNTKAIVEYISGALSNLGIKVDLKGMEVADMTKDWDEKTFDALSMAWSAGSPPEQTRQLWDSAEASKKGSANAINFINLEVDDITNKLEVERDPLKRKELYYRFDNIIHDEQPYTFLYTSKTTLLYREWVKNIFIPAENQEIIPGANIITPYTDSMWLSPESP